MKIEDLNEMMCIQAQLIIVLPVTATTKTYTLTLPGALPICRPIAGPPASWVSRTASPDILSVCPAVRLPGYSRIAGQPDSRIVRTTCRDNLRVCSGVGLTGYSRIAGEADSRIAGGPARMSTRPYPRLMLTPYVPVRFKKISHAL